VSRGAPDPGDIWLVVILACTNQNSIWDTCNDTEGTPCDDTVLRWLHTLNRQWLEVVVNLLLARLAMTIFDPDRSRTVSIDFIDNPYHGEHHAEKGELCLMAPKDGDYDLPPLLHGVRRLEREAGDAGDDFTSAVTKMRLTRSSACSPASKTIPSRSISSCRQRILQRARHPPRS